VAEIDLQLKKPEAYFSCLDYWQLGSRHGPGPNVGRHFLAGVQAGSSEMHVYRVGG
jgi:hypothetical protein